MTELLTSAQMRAIESAAIATGAVTGAALMEYAGRGVVEAVFARWPALAAGTCRAVVLCGPGNNGGDGFVVARVLADRGWQVEVFLFGDPPRLPPDARANHDRWCATGRVRRMDGDAIGAGDLAGFDLVVDAVFGTGLTRPLPDGVSAFLTKGFDGAKHARIVAVDVPSGLDADTGRLWWDGPMPYPLAVSLTVSFHRAKRGHYLGDGGQVCGSIKVVPIGLDRHRADFPAAERLELLDPLDHDAVQVLGKGAGHKFSHGHALILSGGVGHGGAARLAARGALRIGAGLVTLGCPPAALIENAAQLNAVMLRPVKGAEGLGAALADTRITALCLGPGMGVGLAAAMLPAALDAKRATVLDADALTALAQSPDLFARLHGRCVLTPHAGEFARLFPDISERLKDRACSKVDATRDAAARAGCVVLFKGADTVIADARGCCRLNAAFYDRAAPWLATAGAGDVLSGFIAGLLARGIAPMRAAELAASLHVDCARSFGAGLIAEDLPEALPKVFRQLGV